MTDEPRILTDDETYRLRREQASGVGAKIVALCAYAGCPRAAANSPWCAEHRPRFAPDIGSVVVAHDLTEDEYITLRGHVEADAAPLFVLAMNWIAGQQVARLGVGLDAIEASMHRIRGELEQGTS